MLFNDRACLSGVVSYPVHQMPFTFASIISIANLEARGCALMDDCLAGSVSGCLNALAH